MTKIDIHFQIDSMERKGIFSKRIAKIERRLVSIVEKMEETGIKIDPKKFDIIEEEVSEELEKLRKKIFSIVGREFNLNSTQELSNLLFDEIGITYHKFKKTKSGSISISSKDLDLVRDEHQIIDYIINYRELNKLHSTYIKVLPDIADKNYRVKSSYDQLGTATGRMSSSNPNLQNIASHSKIGQQIRYAFVSEKDHSFVSIDYSQMELRIAAHISKEKTLLDAFRHGEDIHTKTASKVFGIPMDNVSEDERYRAKFLNFGMLYGISPYGFARHAKCTVEEGEEYIKKYFKELPGIYKYTQDTIEFLQQYGYVKTLWGRRRYLPKIMSQQFKEVSSAKRMAINHPIQGTSADIIKRAMILVDNKLLSKYDKIKLLLQIHDELLFEIHDDQIDFFVPQLKEIISNAVVFDNVEMTVDIKVGKNLRDMTKI